MNIALRLGVYNTQSFTLKSFYFTYLIFVYIKRYWKGRLILFLHTNEPSMFNGNECRAQFKMCSLSLEWWRLLMNETLSSGTKRLKQKHLYFFPVLWNMQQIWNSSTPVYVHFTIYWDYLYCFTLTFIISEIAGKMAQKWPAPPLYV